MSTKQLIFIFGMGRSGTSALARVVSLCGAALPETLLGPNEGNPKGHWEPLEALALNDGFLLRHGASWFDPTLRLQGGIPFTEKEQEAYIEQIRIFLEKCPNEPVLVIKEPRIVALSDFWFEAAHRAGFITKIIIPVRHPEEVAASLATRDGLSAELSNVLWLKYNLLAERRSRHLSRVFVEYSELLNNWRRQIGRISEALSIDLSHSDDAAINRFLSSDLYRQKRFGPLVEPFDQPWLGQVYAAFSAASRGSRLDVNSLDEIFSAFSSYERPFRVALEEYRRRFAPDSTKELETIIHDQKCLLAEKESALAALQPQLLARKAVETLQERLDLQNRRLAETARNLNEICASRGWRALSSYYRVRNKLFPDSSLRKRFVQRLLSPFSS
jgi:hypothetical protein